MDFLESRHKKHRKRCRYCALLRESTKSQETGHKKKEPDS